MPILIFEFNHPDYKVNGTNYEVPHFEVFSTSQPFWTQIFASGPCPQIAKYIRIILMIPFQYQLIAIVAKDEIYIITIIK